MKARKPPEVCPVCDADVPADAKACPECGACYNSGWNYDGGEEEEEIDYEALDLPDDAYDDEEKRRMKESRRAKRLIPSKWRRIALILVIIWLLWFWWMSGAGSLW